MHEDQYWQAVLDRDSRSDGMFVYAVRSTGIYCNPSCPSRRPRRAQVRFFARATEAEQAGFRPCRRCRPQETSTGEPHVAIVERTCTIIDSQIEADPEAPLTLATLGDQVGMSPFHLQRIFKRAMGITPHQYADARRIQQFKTRLKTNETITNAMYEAGYGSSSRLYERAPAQLGMTPGAYQRGGQGMNIAYTIVDCQLGRLLVAATEKGVCAVSLGDNDKALEAALWSEYPAAEIQRDGSGLDQWVQALLRYIAGQQPHLDLPLDVQATAFQWRVWRELQAIPYGQTRSYGEVAQALGDPHKARAVAQACATNPVALVIPCHRVVRNDGEHGGYRWGTDRKRRLLSQEQTENARLDPVN